MSARYTYVSPAGRFPDGSRIVDGGYFENSGATTAYELATRIKERCALPKHEIKNVDVKVIMISNDPRKESIMIAPAKPGPEPPGPKRSKPPTVTGHFMGEITAPLYTMMNTRTARGTYAQKAIKLEQRPYKAVKLGAGDASAETPAAASATEPAEPRSLHIFYFNLRDTQVPLPLGWMLSKAAAEAMQSQLHENDPVVQNGAMMDEVLKTLPPATPPPANDNRR